MLQLWLRLWLDVGQALVVHCVQSARSPGNTAPRSCVPRGDNMSKSTLRRQLVQLVKVPISISA